MYFSLTISMYQGTKIALKNALFLGFFQSAKTGNFRALLTRSENGLLGDIFTSLCCNCDTKIHVKEILRLQREILLDFSKSKTLGQVLVLFSKIVDQRVSPGKI